MRPIIGILMLVTAGVTTSGLGGVATRLARAETPQGVRAIIVHGSMLRGPILISDFDMATALHGEVTRAAKYAEQLPPQQLRNRPCLGMAVFLPASRTARIPLNELKPDQADAKLRYYPATETEAAVIGRSYVSEAQVVALSSYGVPVSVPATSKERCN
jgi:hypothetical protein